MRDKRYGEFPEELELEPGDRFRVAVNYRTPNTDDYGDMQKLTGQWLTVASKQYSDDASKYAPLWSHRVKAEPQLKERLKLKYGVESYYWEYYHMDQIERKAERGQRMASQKKDLLPPL